MDLTPSQHYIHDRHVDVSALLAADKRTYTTAATSVTLLAFAAERHAAIDVYHLPLELQQTRVRWVNDGTDRQTDGHPTVT